MLLFLYFFFALWSKPLDRISTHVLFLCFFMLYLRVCGVHYYVSSCRLTCVGEFDPDQLVLMGSFDF